MENQKIVISDIDMPFLSMVSFMVKWAIAVIPAAIILFLIAGVLGMFFGSMLSSFTVF